MALAGYDVAYGHADAQVRATPLRRDAARGVGEAGAYIVVSPVAPPRLWRLVADAALDAFERVVTEGARAAERPPPAAVLERAAAATADAVARLRDALIEPHLKIDAEVGIVLAAGSALHLALSAGVRLFRARGGVPEQLHARGPQAAGLAAPLFTAVEAVAPGDVYVLGSRDAFGVRAMSNLATVLTRPGRLPAAQACEALLGPCRAAGTSAAAVALVAP